MKVEELILKLKEIQSEIGNVDVWIEDGDKIAYYSKTGKAFTGKTSDKKDVCVIQKVLKGWG